jgi:hypothetical protein
LQNGLQGCGLSTALGLAHAGYGTMLVEGITTSDDTAAFLAKWREALVRELGTNQSGFFISDALMSLSQSRLGFLTLILSNSTSIL